MTHSKVLQKVTENTKTQNYFNDYLYSMLNNFLKKAATNKVTSVKLRPTKPD